MKENNFPIEFVVKEINDLSLTYKRSQEIKKRVIDNFKNREIIRVQNHFLVS